MKEWEGENAVRNPLDSASLTAEEKLLQRCKERSLYLLTGQAKTERRLREKLAKSAHYTEEIIEKTLSFLKEYGYLDDYRYAVTYLQENAGKRSLRDMKAKLFLRGVEADALARAVEDFRESGREEEEDPEREALRVWVEKKSRTLDLTDRKDRERLFASLMRKGFSYSMIREVLQGEDEWE